jgi:AcrR family transcriptional regulator
MTAIRGADFGRVERTGGGKPPRDYHFESKADLVAEVLASALAEGNTEFAKFVSAPVDESTTALRRYIRWYLSQAHRDNIDHGCPVAGFAGDAPRLDAGAQSHFAGGLDDQMTILAGLIAESGSLAAEGGTQDVARAGNQPALRNAGCAGPVTLCRPSCAGAFERDSGQCSPTHTRLAR